MKKESKHNRNSKRKAECSCSIPEKDITNLAARAVQEGKETQNSNLAVAEQTGSETAKCCSRLVGVSMETVSMATEVMVMITTQNCCSHPQIKKNCDGYNL